MLQAFKTSDIKHTFLFICLFAHMFITFFAIMSGSVINFYIAVYNSDQDSDHSLLS